MKFSDLLPKKPIVENKKQAQLYVQQGKLSTEDFNKLVQFDPTSTKKFVGWMAKQYINKPTSGIKSDDQLRNTIEEYNTFLKSGKAKTKDIFQFATFTDLAKEVDEINATGAGDTQSDLRNRYEVKVDDADLLIIVPKSHEASRYLGITKFQFRQCVDEEGNLTGKLDSAWCTTFKAPDHFIDYYYAQKITLYYIRVRSEEMQKKLIDAFPNKEPGEMTVVALLVDKNGDLFDGYDGLDEKLTKKEINKFREIIGY